MRSSVKQTLKATATTFDEVPELNVGISNFIGVRAAILLRLSLSWRRVSLIVTAGVGWFKEYLDLIQHLKPHPLPALYVGGRLTVL